MNEIRLGARLGTIASLVRQNAVLCDVGTDHALLPLYLLQSGRCPRAIASDVRRGPLASAAKNAALYGMESKIDLRLTDGLNGLEGCGADDIVIAGMGGELIAEILSRAAFTRDPKIRLLLQPMTRQNALRVWLSENGYRIEEEALVLEEKLYQILVVSYDGKKRTLTEAEAAVGPDNLRRRSPLLSVHLSRLIAVWETKKSGKASTGADTPEEDAVLAQLRAWKKEYAE